MEQLSLNITPRLAYSAEGFLLHEGVSTIIDHVRVALSAKRFTLFYITGGNRSGKTHLSIYLSDILGKEGRFPRLIEGEEIDSRTDLIASDPGEVLLVDDIDTFLKKKGNDASGPFVNLIESYRKALCPVILFGTTPVEALTNDDHVMSRLRAGTVEIIQAPLESSLPELIELMAKQRGIRLSDRKVDFLIKRLNRSIPEIESYLERLNYLSGVFGKAIKFPLLSDAL